MFFFENNRDSGVPTMIGDVQTFGDLVQLIGILICGVSTYIHSLIRSGIYQVKIKYKEHGSERIITENPSDPFESV
jgi:hypothetical protein